MKRLLVLLTFGMFLSIQAQTFNKLINANLQGATGDWYVATPVDYDGDGLMDLILAGSNADKILRQTATNQFQLISTLNVVTTPNSSATGSFWMDLDNDCDLDVFWPNQSGTAPSALYENNGDGTFTRVTNGGHLTTDAMNATTVSWGDYDNDGYVDAFVCRFGSSTAGLQNRLYRNNGNMTFTRVGNAGVTSTSEPTWCSAWVDVDNDNDVDLFVCNRNNRHNELYINQGNGTFLPNDSSALTNLNNNTATCSWGDYNNDGYLDVFIGNVLGQPNELHKNNGDGTFTQIFSTPLTSDQHSTIGSTWGDFNNDGRLDLFVGNNTNIYANNNIVYINQGNDNFTKITSGPQYTAGEETYCVNAVDFNQDGDLDLITNARYNTAPSIYLNQGNNNHFISFDLSGSTSSRTPVGTRLVIKTASGVKQTRVVGMTTGYNTHDDYQVHFGTAQDTLVDSLWVYWPNGQTCVKHHLATNQKYVLIENNCFFNTPAVAQFGTQVAGATVGFNNQSTGAYHGVKWDFGDGNSSQAHNPTHSYAATGTYTVQLTLYTHPCDSVEVSQTVTVSGCVQQGQANFISAMLPSSNTSVQFTSTSTFASSYFWDFGDGSGSNLPNPIRNYGRSGTFTVCLAILDSCGNRDTSCQQITVCQNPAVAAFTATKMPNSANGIQFYSNSTNAISHNWDFGDGTSSTGVNPLKFYATAGVYTICLKVVDACGLMDSTCTTLDTRTFVGLNEYDLNEYLSVYPNPFGDELNLSIDLVGETFDVTLYSVNGQKVYSETVVEGALVIPTEHLAKGYYLLQIEGQKGKATRAVIKY